MRDLDKSPDAFRTISEVAADLGLPQHVLRFWETKFPQIKPLKRGGGRRYYRPDDVELLRGIRHLLYGEGYTIRGVQRILKEQGVRFVMNVWREGAPQPKGARGPASGRASERPEPVYDLDDGVYEQSGEGEDLDGGYDPDEAEPIPPSAEPSAAAMAQRFAPRGPAGDDDRMLGRPRDMGHAPVARPVAHTSEPADVPPPSRTARSVAGPEEGDPRSALGTIMDRFRGGTPREAEPLGPEPNPRLTGDQVRRLQATLFELLECKRLLDQVR